MRSNSAHQKKDRHGMVNMYYVVPAKIMLYISMETGPATLSPVAEVEPCSTSAFWSRRPPVHRRHPATAPRQVAGLSSVVGRCVFGESAFRCKRGFGSPRIWIPHPKTLADLDPSIYFVCDRLKNDDVECWEPNPRTPKRGFGSPADLDPDPQRIVEDLFRQVRVDVSGSQ